MLLKRFYDEKLAQASYLVGCAATGESLVIDPNRDVEQYVRAAAAEGMRISHVTETHIHADFVSGSRELAARTGAQLLLSDEGDADWKYAFASASHPTLLKEGSRFMVGNIRVEVLHTPGHTPEHLSFLITDTARVATPIGIFTGDFVFVGDVGRPDLLEKAAGVSGTMEAGARALYRSLRRFKALPDHLQVWPGHGAGSACGKSLGAIPSTTVGYEKISNWAFADLSEDEFIAQVLAGQPEPPVYFAEMKRQNKQGPRVLQGRSRPRPMHADAIDAVLATDAIVVDTRPWAQFSAGHVPGTINIPFNRAFVTWAGWLVPYDRDIYLIVAGGDDAARAVVSDLALIGLDRVYGIFADDAIAAWSQGRRLQPAPQVSAPELAARQHDVTVIDVRSAAEWEGAHIPGSLNIPLGDLPHRAAEVPPDRPVVMQCQTGGRSAIATSLLRAQGMQNVSNLAGGIQGWRSAGQRVQSGASEPDAEARQVA